MKRYSRKELAVFLQAIDANLEKPVEIILIGGTAALLVYKASRATQDIDTFNSVTQLQEAYKKAKQATGLDVPFSQSGVADGPYNFEERLQIYEDLKLKYLKILVPEAADLILMKVIRAYEPDLETIKELIQKQRVSMKVLVERFKHEMDHVVTDPKKLKLNFLAMIEENFPTADLATLDKEILP